MSEPIETEIVPESQALAVRPDAGAVDKALPADQIKAPITAAQAKVDAVAALTMSAYEKAATLELTPEEAAKLQADFPDEAFQPGAAGKENLIYIEHAHLRDRFNSVFGMGKWAIVPRSRWAEPFRSSKGTEGSRVYVEAMLVVRGCFVGEAVGAMEYYPSNASQNYGDAVEGAKTAAFRRCSKEFGVGLQAWKKEWCEGWWQRKRAGSRSAPPQRAEAPARSGVTPPPAKPAPAPRQEAAAPIPVPNEESLKKMIESLKACPGMPNRGLVTEYFTKLENTLMPGEDLESLPLRFVPSTTGQMRSLADKIARFGNGEPAAPAYPPHSMAVDFPATKTPAQVLPAVMPAPGKPQGDPSCPSVRGEIAQVTLKEGKSGTGKPWSLWGIKIGETWVNTFSNTLGQMAMENKGSQATLFYEAEERGNKAVELVLADGTRHTAGES